MKGRQKEQHSNLVGVRRDNLKAGLTAGEEGGATEVMLGAEDLKAITLKAPYVWEHGDRPYFHREINAVATQLKEQGFLNFFVRYRSDKNDPSRHKWSRIREVILMKSKSGIAHPEEGATASQVAPLSISVTPLACHKGQERDGDGDDSAHSAIRWRGKTFRIALLVVGESDPVHLPRLSAQLPGDDEVVAFCASQVLFNPTEVYRDASSAAPVVVMAEEPVNPIGEPTLASTRRFLPTAAQIAKLKRYREQRLTQHQWTQEELEEALELNRRKSHSSPPPATAPLVATANHMHNLKVKTRLMQLQKRQLLSQATQASLFDESPGEGPSQVVSQPAATTAAAGGALCKDVFLGDAHTYHDAEDVLLGPSSPQRRRFAPPVAAVPRSPFLPRKFHQGRRPGGAGGGGPNGGASLRGQLASQQAPASSLPTASLESAIGQETVAHWEKAVRQEERFYQYVSDPQRSAYLEKVATITQRNALANKRNRVRALEEERKLKRRGNLMESGGLWVTDDKLRSEKAAMYKAEKEAEGGDLAGVAAGHGAGSKSKSSGGGTVAWRNGETSGGAAAKLQTPEQLLLERFMQERRAQEMNFSAIPDEWFRAEPDAAPHGGLRGNNNAVSLSLHPRPTAAPVPYAATPYRLAGPPGANAEEVGTGKVKLQYITSHLLHHSVVSMAM